jgi:aryl-alcohol dehydrogenase-like predicted oxidoreductase
MNLLSLSGKRLYPICLGTAEFGSRISRETSFALLDLYHEQEGNFFDSAHIYASWIPGGEGKSEQTLGDWLARQSKREDLFVATKGGHPHLESMDQARLKMDSVMQDFNESMDRLQLEWIDLYWFHRDDPQCDVNLIADILAALHATGRVRYFGGSNWTPQRLEELNHRAETQGTPRLSCSQRRWSFAVPPPPPAGMGLVNLEQEAWDFHCTTAMPVIPYSSQAVGFLGAQNVEWARGGFTGAAPKAAEYDSPENRRRLLWSIKQGEQCSATPNQVALRWMMHQPFPCYPIIGTGNKEHLSEALLSTQMVAPDEYTTVGKE